MSERGSARLPAHLLGRHVTHRPEDDAGLGRRRSAVGRLGRSLGRRLGLRQLGETEVEDLDAAVARHEQVLGLQVAVHDPLLVRGGEPVRDLDRVVDGLARRESAAATRRSRSVSPSRSSETR